MSYDKEFEYSANWDSLYVNTNPVAWYDEGTGKIPTSLLPDTVVGSVEYKGTWNANTNVPDLGASSPDKGDYYVVSVAGTTSLGGITDWNLGDWAIYNGTAWEKVDNTQEIDDTPQDGVTTRSISSNWAYDHASDVNNSDSPAHVPQVATPTNTKYLRDDGTFQSIPSTDLKLAIDGRENGNRVRKDEDGDIEGFVLKTTTDYYVWRGIIPNGFDVSKSCRFILAASWDTGNQATSVNLDMNYELVDDGDNFTTAMSSTTLAAPSANQDLRLTGFYHTFPASTFTVGQFVKIRLSKAGAGGEDLMIRKSMLEVQNT